MNERQQYIKHKFQKAVDSLNAAEILCENNMPEQAISKIYYAMFNAALALLINIRLSPKTHSGVKNIFHKEFILSGKVDARMGKLYDLLLFKRFETDYEDFVSVDKEEVPGYINEVRSFIEKAKDIINISSESTS